MNSRDRKETQRDMKWEHIVLIMAIVALLVGLGIISIVSYFQTEQSYKNLNDPSIIIFGLSIGSWISNAFAMVTQYGQNGVLYIRKRFLTGKTMFRIPLFGNIVTDKGFALSLFFILAGIDALTNIVWFYNNSSDVANGFLGWAVRIIGYSAMIGSVFVEEVIGKTLSALSRAMGELKSILEWEERTQRTSSSTNNNDQNQRNETMLQNYPNRENHNRLHQPSPRGAINSPQDMLRNRLEPTYHSVRNDNRYEG